MNTTTLNNKRSVGKDIHSGNPRTALIIMIALAVAAVGTIAYMLATSKANTPSMSGKEQAREHALTKPAPPAEPKTEINSGAGAVEETASDAAKRLVSALPEKGRVVGDPTLMTIEEYAEHLGYTGEKDKRQIAIIKQSNYAVYGVIWSGVSQYGQTGTADRMIRKKTSSSSWEFYPREELNEISVRTQANQ